MSPAQYIIGCRLLDKQLCRLQKLRAGETEYYAALMLLEKQCAKLGAFGPRKADSRHLKVVEFLCQPDIVEHLSLAAKHIQDIVKQKDKESVQRAERVCRQIRGDRFNLIRVGVGYGQPNYKVSGGLPK